MVLALALVLVPLFAAATFAATGRVIQCYVALPCYLRHSTSKS